MDRWGIETHQPRWYRLMKTCSVCSKRRDQYQSDNRDTNDKLNPLYKLSTLINTFHDIEKHLSS